MAATTLDALRWIGTATLIAASSWACSPPSNTQSRSNRQSPPDASAGSPKTAAFPYRQCTERSGATSYIYEAKEKPRIDISLDGTPTNLSQVNAALQNAGLPPVSTLPTLVRDRQNMRKYWYGYPLGVMQLQLTTCAWDSATAGYPTCAWKITIEPRDGVASASKPKPC
jgi:hypothetical protein